MSEATVMVVDDNCDEAALTVRALNRAGIRADAIHVANGGSEAIDYLTGSGQFAGRDIADQPHLMLLDLKMAGLDGLEVLRRLRQDERTRRLPIVMLTASDNPRDVTNIYNLGANSYLRKSFDFDEFAQTIQQVVAYWVHLNTAPPPERPTDQALRKS
jgi:two-component system response regulator